MSEVTLNPTADHATSTYASSTGANFYSVLADGSDASYAFGGDNFETVDQWWVECEFEDMPSALSISSVAVYFRAKNGSGLSGTNRCSSRIKTTAGTSGGTLQTLSGSFADYSQTYTSDPTTSAAWTPAGVNAARFGISYDVIGFPSPGARIAPDIAKCWVVVTYSPVPPTVDVTRHLLSVDLWMKRRPEYYGNFFGNMDVLNVPMLGSVDLEHTMGPNATGVGWEGESWQRRAFAVHGLNIDLNAMSVGARIKDQRPIRCLVRDLAWSDKASASLGDGIARFATPGASFTFTRPDAETYTNPVGESETVQANVAGYADGGLQILAGSSSRYYVTNNSTARTFNAAQGTFQCEVKFIGTLAEDRVIAYCYHDASNWAKVFYDNASGKIKFSLRSQGTTTTITALAGAVTATWYQVGVYWTGFNLENDHAAPSIALYIDRVLQEVAAMGGSSSELVLNGGAESVFANWTNDSVGTNLSVGATGSGLGPRTGTYSIRCSVNLGGNGVASARQDLTAVEGRSITVSAYCITGNTSTVGRVRLRNLTTGNYYNGSTNAWEPAAADIGSSNATSYTLITETLTIEGTGESVILRLTLECEGSSSRAAHFDDISAVMDIGGSAMAEVASSNFDFGSEAGSNLLRGQIRKIHSYQHVLTPTEMQRQI